MQEISINKYYQTKSDIHELNGFTKLISLLIFVIGMFKTNSINILSIYFIIELMIILLSNVPIKNYIRSIKAVRFLLIFIIIINLISKTDFIVPVTKIILIIFYSNIFIYTTTPNEITKSFEQLLYPLNYFKINTKKIAYTISLAITFIPNIFSQATRILKAISSRGIDNNENLKNKIITLKSIVFPMFILTIKKADYVSDVMELKLYDLDNVKYKPIQQSFLDTCFIIINVILLMLEVI